MSVNWTEEQREAVYAPVSNILVTAAAGAGKTQVLTGRILNRITEGADITKMLVVTFTNAAAAEMKGRISDALSGYLAKNPGDTHVRNQLMYMPTANIQTIHSFCLDMIRNNFFRLDIKPDFKICDGAEGDMLCAEAMEMMLSTLYEEGEESFITFADSFSTVYGDRNITEMVLELFKFAESMPHPEKWLEEQKKIYEGITEENYESSVCAVVIREYVKRALLRGKYSLEGAREMCTPERGLESYGAMLSRDIEAIDELLSKKGWDELSGSAGEFGFAPRKALKDCDEETKEIVVSTRDAVKKSIEDALGTVTYSVSENVFLIRHNKIVIDGLVKAVLCFKEQFTLLKKERNILDFNDIEHYCIKLLEDEDIAAERKNFYDEIYVDEYQDSNPAQEYIFNKISGDETGRPNRFMVGDVKQSIYGFRHTSPELFLEKKDTYRQGDTHNRKIILGKNFRSSRNVIDFVNRVCEKIMCRDIGGVDYDEEERLVFKAPYPEKEVNTEINVIYGKEKLDSAEKAVAEAQFIAEKIKELCKEKVYDVKLGAERSVAYSDITVLMRSVRDSAPVFEKVFEKYGIPIFVDGDTAYFDSSESKTVLSMLTVIDNPLNDIPLISVMRSPIGGFDENELAEIKSEHKNENFYNDVKAEAESGKKYGEKCKAFLDMLTRMRKYAKYMPVNRLLEKVIYETGYFDAVCAMPGAEVRIENLNQLTESARKYENASYRGLYNFINYINNVKASGGKMGEAKVACEGQNAVRVMSIHKSKGLEFPIVFLARCGKRMNTQNQNGTLVLHKDCPIGLKYADAKKRITYDTPIRQAAKICIARDELSEEIRILYVALTRAKERIIITGCADNKDIENKGKIDAVALRDGKFIEKHSYLEYFLAVAQYCKGEGIPGIELNFINAETAQESMEETGKSFEFSEKSVKIIEENLSYKYEREHLWEIPSKLTVTELKRLQEQNISDTQLLYTDIDIKIPAFMEEEQKSGAKRGQLIHFVMQNIDFSLQSREEVDNFVNSLVEKKILSPSEGDAVDTKKIHTFLSSELCALIRKADKLYREEPFAILVPASVVTGKNEDFDEKIMVQGIIDCYFIIDDNIYLVDYKSDRNCNREYIINHYRKQLEIYEIALEKKYFRKIFKKFIYLFNNNDIIEL